MPKKLLEDIKPLSRKSESKIKIHIDETPQVILPREVPFEPTASTPKSHHALLYIAIICIFGILFSLSYLFEKAVVVISPRSVPVGFDSTEIFSADKDSNDPDAIVYTLMSLSGDESLKLPSTESKDQSIPATGKVVLYNSYSTSPYKLVAGTRLSSTDSNIYKLNSAAVIPGYKKVSGEIVPGSVEVAVTAALPGEASNIDTGDFTLPGLAGSPQAKLIFGRTKTAISGGVSGTIYSIPKDSASAALGTLQMKLKNTLLSKMKVQIPDGYIFYPGAIVFQTDDSVSVPYSKEKDVPLALHGSLTAYLIKEDTLVKAIATRSISQYAGGPVVIPHVESLQLAPTVPLSPLTDSTFSFTFAGSVDVVWSIKKSDIQDALSGKKKSEFEKILAGVPGVEHAEVVLKPFWKQSFPGEASRINVTIK